MPNSKNLPCWMCGNVCIKSSSCSFRSLSLLHFFRCVLQALSSQVTEVNWLSENKQNKMCSTLNLLSFCSLSQKLCPLMLTGFLIQKIILLEWYYLCSYIQCHLKFIWLVLLVISAYVMWFKYFKTPFPIFRFFLFCTISC